MSISWCYVLLILEWLTLGAELGTLFVFFVRYRFSFAQYLSRFEQLVFDTSVLHLDDASAGGGHITKIAPREARALSLTKVTTPHITETLYAVLLAQHLRF